MAQMLTSSNANWLYRLLMVQQLSKERRFVWLKESDSYLMSFVTPEEWLWVTCNGLRIYPMLLQAACKESGNKRQKKTWCQWLVRLLVLSTMRLWFWREPQRKNLCWLVLNRWWLRLQRKWLRHLWNVR